VERVVGKCGIHEKSKSEEGEEEEAPEGRGVVARKCRPPACFFETSTLYTASLGGPVARQGEGGFM